jgi:hypothetical protein
LKDKDVPPVEVVGDESAAKLTLEFQDGEDRMYENVSCVCYDFEFLHFSIEKDDIISHFTIPLINLRCWITSEHAEEADEDD